MIRADQFRQGVDAEDDSLAINTWLSTSAMLIVDSSRRLFDPSSGLHIY